MAGSNENFPVINAEMLAYLRQYDTPTICNALDIAAPDKSRTAGFTRRQLVALDPDLPPMVGYARTAMIRSTSSFCPAEKRAKALEYYEYTASGEGPTIVVIQDIDTNPGLGAHWGEVHTALHQKLGSMGAITNGSFRDIDDSAKGFQVLGGSVNPSHAYVHVVDYGCEVEIFGMNVRHADLLHADKHGAVVIPHEVVEKLPAAIETIIQREKVILDAVKHPNFDIEMLKVAVGKSADIH
ncbi:RraA family protein [Marinobacterium rhizophilum]|uniref:RraA family protein n=1 Tax=Marinobacterium rhizophilum TaxID=420402 RepID=A0ABY5HI10_9GAMM|nr:RraA family protein [Marinobacterium rhizophilum]UTW11998.1 RraA family protein [Marinobacterium rhizophilum]